MSIDGHSLFVVLAAVISVHLLEFFFNPSLWLFASDSPIQLKNLVSEQYTACKQCQIMVIFNSCNLLNAFQNLTYHLMKNWVLLSIIQGKPTCYLLIQLQCQTTT